ncbi:MAG: histidine kinase, partial [Chitinophagaceae bacterium]
KSDKTPEAIVTLSKMMRYSIDEGSRPLVMLNKELEYIESYMKLQSLRLTPATSVAYQVSGATNEVKIVPFLLIPFVENAFKYGADSEHPSVIEVSIVIRERTLQATITNSKMSELAIKEKGTGLGIQTTRQRLELLYPGAYELHISDTPDRFLVTLQLQL